MSLEDWREANFQLAWHQHGGSGLQISHGEVLDLSPQDRNWHLERIAAQRTREAKAIENAGKRGT